MRPATSAVRLGRNVHRWRLQHCMTKAEFCNYAIVSRPFLDAMESGRSNITLDYLVYIARSLGMEPWELIR